MMPSMRTRIKRRHNEPRATRPLGAIKGASDNDTKSGSGFDFSIAKGGVARPFPWRLHDMLDAAIEEGLTDVVAWQPHGRAFTVYKPKEFVDHIMTRYVGYVSLTRGRGVLSIRYTLLDGFLYPIVPPVSSKH
jgi:HSF-type DNA-binding